MQDQPSAAPVLLTRPQGRNAPLAQALRQAGLSVIDAPALAISWLDTPRPVARPGDLLIFVSGQAVTAYFSQQPVSWPAEAWAGAVGGATAQALQAHVPPARILSPADDLPPDSESLLAVIQARGLRPGRVHILRATEGRDWLANQLRQLGWQVACHALYRRDPCVWDPAICTRLASSEPLVLLVTSLEALAAIEANLQACGVSWPPALQVVTLHERIARRLQYLYADQPDGMLHVTLSSPDGAALFQAIVAASRQLSRRT
ncbi:uroporphyrinogen-III synthase [Castellaniella sp.]|uniref:uroporphyrinogen-III synthase n=1 Tax=Castellaniella sp. TaxID=1955812 RepID=UPI002AFE2843|nr:uroporphyrinogen-III synthase [Castellaniella sp.]